MTTEAPEKSISGDRHRQAGGPPSELAGGQSFWCVSTATRYTGIDVKGFLPTVKRIASTDVGHAAVSPVHHTAVQTVLPHGREALRQRYLDDLLAGSTIGALAVNEPDVSSSNPHPCIEGSIGNFANMVALRCRMADDPAFADLVIRARDEIREVVDNSAVSFPEVVNAAHPERVGTRNPIFQADVTLCDGDVMPLQFEGIYVQYWLVRPPAVKGAVREEGKIV